MEDDCHHVPVTSPLPNKNNGGGNSHDDDVPDDDGIDIEDNIIEHTVAMIVYGGGTGVHGGGGTFLGDNTTIITADHVLVKDSTTLILIDRFGNEVTYNIADLTVQYLGGDMVMITLPSTPSALIVSPATESSEYTPVAGDSIVTTQFDWSNWNANQTVSFRTITTTVVDSYILIPPNRISLSWGAGFQLENNTDMTFGDSGGGVFYNGQFVGSNQALNSFKYPNMIVQQYSPP